MFKSTSRTLSYNNEALLRTMGPITREQEYKKQNKNNREEGEESYGGDKHH